MTVLERAGPATLPYRRQGTRALRLVSLYTLDMAVFVAFFVVYFLGRGLPADRIDLSTANAGRIIALERDLGIFREAAWQHAAQSHSRLIEAANFTYMQLHMPLLAVAGFGFFCADARKHRVIRNTILLSAFLALPIYAAFPVTPPRLLAHAGLDLGFTDTLTGLRPAKPGIISNWYAAMPSYHFGWIALAAAGVWWTWRNTPLRLVALLFAAWMWFSIVVTGNHYFLDMVAGAAMVVVAAFVAVWWEDFAERHPGGVGRFTISFAGRRLPF